MDRRFYVALMPRCFSAVAELLVDVASPLSLYGRPMITVSGRTLADSGQCSVLLVSLSCPTAFSFAF